MKKLILFGGTFNPFHLGHLAMLENAHVKFPDIPIVIIPNFIPPIKENKIITTDKQPKLLPNRIKILDQITKKLPYCSLNLIEIDQAKISYTIETLKYFQQTLPNTEFFYLIGSDNYFILHQWKDYQEVIKLTNFIVINRKTVPMQDYQDYYNKYLNLVKFDKFIFLNIEPIPISSQKIRQLIINKLPYQSLVPNFSLDFL